MTRIDAWLFAAPGSWGAAIELVLCGLLLLSAWCMLAMSVLARAMRAHLSSLPPDAEEEQDAWVEHGRTITPWGELWCVAKEEWSYRLLRLGLPFAAYLLLTQLSYGASPYRLAVAAALLAYSTVQFARMHASAATPWWLYGPVQGALGLLCGVLYLKCGGISGDVLGPYAAAVAAHFLWNRLCAPLTMRVYERTLVWRGLD